MILHQLILVTTLSTAVTKALVEGDYRRFRVAEEMPPNTVVCDLVAELGLRSKYDPDIVQQLRFRFNSSFSSQFLPG